MKTAVYANYKPTRYEGKGFLRNLNIRIHRDKQGVTDCSQNVVNSGVINRNPQEPAEKKEFIRHCKIKWQQYNGYKTDTNFTYFPGQKTPRTRH